MKKDTYYEDRCAAAAAGRKSADEMVRRGMSPKKQTLKKFPRAYSEDGGLHRNLAVERFRIYDGNGGVFRRCLGHGPNFRAAWAMAANADKI